MKKRSMSKKALMGLACGLALSTQGFAAEGSVDESQLAAGCASQRPNQTASGCASQRPNYGCASQRQTASGCASQRPNYGCASQQGPNGQPRGNGYTADADQSIQQQRASEERFNRQGGSCSAMRSQNNQNNQQQQNSDQSNQNQGKYNASSQQNDASGRRMSQQRGDASTSIDSPYQN